jgi:hypothetical protein
MLNRGNYSYIYNSHINLKIPEPIITINFIYQILKN